MSEFVWTAETICEPTVPPVRSAIVTSRFSIVQSGHSLANCSSMASVATLRMAKSGMLTTSTLASPPESEMMRSASRGYEAWLEAALPTLA